MIMSLFFSTYKNHKSEYPVKQNSERYQNFTREWYSCGKCNERFSCEKDTKND